MRRVAFYQQLVAGLTEAGYTVIKAFLEHTPQEVLDDMAQVGPRLHQPPSPRTYLCGGAPVLLLLAPVRERAHASAAGRSAHAGSTLYAMASVHSTCHNLVCG